LLRGAGCAEQRRRRQPNSFIPQWRRRSGRRNGTTNGTSQQFGTIAQGIGSLAGAINPGGQCAFNPLNYVFH